MKKYFIVSNIVLIIAVIVLFYMQFRPRNVPAKQPVSTTVPPASTLKIAYFEMDSLDNNYQYMQEVKETLMDKSRTVEKQINDLRSEVRNKINEANQKGPTLSQSEQISYSQQIDNLSKENQEKEQRLGQSFSMERDVRLQEVRQRIQDFLKTFAKEKNFNYIIGTNETDYFYYKDSTLDITQDLLTGLNQAYKTEKAGKNK